MQHKYPSLFSRFFIAIALCAGTTAAIAYYAAPIIDVVSTKVVGNVPHARAINNPSRLPSFHAVEETSYFVKFRNLPADINAIVPPQQWQQYGIISFKPAFKLPALSHIFVVTLRHSSGVVLPNMPPAMPELVSYLSHLPNVEYIEPVPDYHFFCTPNDPQFAAQWHLQNTFAADAWDDLLNSCNFATPCADEVVVAIVDDALLTTHEDLAPKIWTNTAEIAANGIDDDSNGYIDDTNGWDAFGNDNNPNPDNPDCTHGTHVAGIVGAATNNALGIASVGFNCRLMPVKSSSCGGSSVEAAYEGVAYAIATSADIISMSWGGGQFSATYQALFDLAYSQGIICIAAAGNDAVAAPMYPASYNHVISVGATDPDNQITYFSNYGTTIDIMAPGEDILSTLATNNTAYGTLSGTSMACPLVSSTAALMLCLDPGMSPDAFESCLENSAVNIDALNPNYIGQIGAGLMNVAAMVNCLHIPPHADFVVDVHTYCLNEAIAFNNTSAGYNISGYQWSFAGGSPATSTALNPVVSFATAGTHNISLTVTNAYGTDTYTATVTVGIPTATLSGNATTVLGANATLSVTYNGTMPYDLVYTDGTTNYTLNNIAQSPYYFNVLASDTTIYTLLSANNSYCTATVAGQGIVNILQIASDLCAYSTIFGTNASNSSGGYYDTDEETFYYMGNEPNFAAINAALGTYSWGINYPGLSFGLVGGFRTDNGDFIRVGGDAWSGTSDWYAARFDAAGNWLWGKRYECPGRQVSPYLLEATNDYFFIGGWFNTSGGTSDDYGIYKIDINNGNVLATVAAEIAGDDQAGGLAYDGAGGVYQLGEVEGSEYLVMMHYDSNLNLIETRRYNPPGFYSLNAGNITALPDGGLLLSVIANAGGDASIVRLDSNLDLVWARSYAMPIATTIASTGACVLGGNNEFYVPILSLDGAWGSPQSFILKFNLDGTLLLAKSYPTANESVGFLGYNANTPGYEVLLGINVPNSATFGDYDFTLIRTDANMSNSCLLDDVAITANAGTWTQGNVTASLSNPPILATNISFGTQNLVLFSDTPCIECELASNCIDSCAIVASDNTVCLGETVSFTAACTGTVPTNYFWILNDTLQFAATPTAQYTFDNIGTYTVQLLAVASDTCFLGASYEVVVANAQGDAIADVSICKGDAAQLIAQGGNSYIWSPDYALSDPTSAFPIATPDTTITYWVDIVNFNGCALRDSVTVWVLPLPVAIPAIKDTTVCGSDTVVVVFNEGISPISNYDYVWSPATGLSCTACFAPTATVTASTTYTLNIENSMGCSTTQTFNIIINEPSDTVLTVDVCAGDDFLVGGSVYSATGTYSDTLLNVWSCDSIVTTHLTVAATVQTDTARTICAGELFAVGNNSYAASGLYSDTLLAASGCDSLVMTHLTVIAVLQTDTSISICEGETFTLGGNSYTESGIYSDTLLTASGCDSLVRSVHLTVAFCGQAPLIIVPTSFSPNNDGINDLWQPVGSGIAALSLQVYNRWGQLVYRSSTDLNAAWNGKWEGRDCELGVYVYHIKGSYSNGEPFEQKGNITLLR